RYKCFDDFVMNWVNDENINSNLHFIPQYKFLLNRNGEIGVDFVGHYERLNSDLEKICKAAGLPSSNIVSLKKINPSSRGNYRHYYTERSAEVVMNLYKKDIELFGYGY
ncbi:sulfotransferase family 2 domain-containing protein, partial [Porticoccus sp.]